MNKKEIYDFLHYGCTVHDASLDYLNFNELDKKITKNTLAKGQSALDETFKTCVSENRDFNKHIVPLSGGLDSRLILGELIKNKEVENQQILAVTYGMPETWDYEIPKKVCKKFNISHELVNLNKEIDWSYNKLVEYAKNHNRPHKFFDGFIHNQIFSKFNSGSSVFWSGFLGGVVGGCNLPNKKINNWEEALNWFKIWHKHPDMTLTPKEYNPLNSLPSEPFLDSEEMSYTDQLDFAIRQKNLIREIVIQDHKKFIQPYTQNPWLSFCMRLPYEKRVNQTFYKKLLLKRHPELFKLPTETNAGLPLNSSKLRVKLEHYLVTIREILFDEKPYQIYIDFEEELRKDNQFSNSVKRALDLLKVNVTNFSAEGLLEQHQNGQDLSKDLLLLASLALYKQSL